MYAYRNHCEDHDPLLYGLPKCKKKEKNRKVNS